MTRIPARESISQVVELVAARRVPPETEFDNQLGSENTFTTED
jgi:hypothetical protein